MVLPNRKTPICAVPEMTFGSMPNDGGHLLMTDAEKIELLRQEPAAEPWVWPFISADEFLNGRPRWCLWLRDIEPKALRTLPQVTSRIEHVKQHRLASTREATRKLAKRGQFGELRSHRELCTGSSSFIENRAFIPMGVFGAHDIVADSCLSVPNATLYHFGILTSTMHMAWMRAVCGRLKSDFRYSAGIVYNNFPWPLHPEGESKTVAVIESAAQTVLDARAAHPGSTLADLYDPHAMPDDLRHAHKVLDRVVDAAYAADGGKKTWSDDAERVGFLFQRYAALTGLLHDAPMNEAMA